MSPLLWAGDQVTKDTQKARVFSASFALVFTDKICLQHSQAHGNVWNKEDLPGEESNQGTFKHAGQTISPWGAPMSAVEARQCYYKATLDHL